MGQAIKKSKKINGRTLIAEYDTDIGSGSYYLYDVVELDDGTGESHAEALSVHETKSGLLAAFDEMKKTLGLG